MCDTHCVLIKKRFKLFNSSAMSSFLKQFLKQQNQSNSKRSPLNSLKMNGTKQHPNRQQTELSAKLVSKLSNPVFGLQLVVISCRQWKHSVASGSCGNSSSISCSVVKGLERIGLIFWGWLQWDRFSSGEFVKRRWLYQHCWINSVDNSEARLKRKISW